MLHRSTTVTLATCGFVLAVFFSLAALAQTPDEIFGSPGQTPDQTSNASAFNRCVTGVCEPQRAKCVGEAGGDAALLGTCEAYLTACLDACRGGVDSYAFPPLPKPAPAPEPPAAIDPPIPSPVPPDTSEAKTAPEERPAPEEKPVPKLVPEAREPEAPDRPEPAKESVVTKAPEPEAAPEREQAPAPEPPVRESTSVAKDGVIPLVAFRDSPLGLACLELGEEGCKRTLESGLGFEDCHAENLATRERCETALTERNGGVFPGCEGLEPRACAIVRDLKLVEYPSERDLEDADARVEEALESGDFAPIPGVTGISDEAEEDAAWRASRSEPDQRVSPALVIIDADRDGLPDDLEEALGVSDAEEARALGLDPTAEALVAGIPLGQPRGAGETDPAFVLTEPGTGEGSGLVISGRCQPSSTCLIYVYTYVPTVLTVKTDANGDFSYDLSKTIGDGSHVAYVAVTDKTGKIERKSSPLAFLVREAQAAETGDLLAPAAAVDTEGKRDIRAFLAGAALLIVLGAGLVWRVTRKTRMPAA